MVESTGRRIVFFVDNLELLEENISISGYHEIKWRRFLGMKDAPWMLNYRLNGDGVLPGTAYVVMATTTAQ